jgi:hypothetical protein
MDQRPSATRIYRKAAEIATEFALDGHTAVPKLYDFFNTLIDEPESAPTNCTPKGQVFDSEYLEIVHKIRHALKLLIGLWEHRAHGKLADADIEQSKVYGHMLSAEAHNYFRCARELQEFLQTGDLPPDFNLQVFTKNDK